jgi:plasmid stabilization system protein ParE
MAANLILAPEAEHDIAEAYAWYEGQRPGLGETYLTKVDACLHAICRSPEAHAVVRGTYRRSLVRQFPYAVFYEFANDSVTVYVICHTSRDPEKWRQRLP